LVRSLVILVGIALVSAAATVLALRYYGHHDDDGRAANGSQSDSGDDSGSRDGDDRAAGADDSSDHRITALARLEPENGIVEINGTPGDRLKELKVKLGDRVARGDALAVLESRTLREGELELAETQLKEAQKRQVAEEGYADAMRAEAELAQEQARLQELDAKAQAEKIAGLSAAYQASFEDLQRLEGVRRSSEKIPGASIVSDQQLAHQRVATDKARNELAAGQDEYKKLRQSIDLSNREATAKLRTAAANRARIPSMVQLDSLQKQVELSRRRLDLTVLRAPSDGEILKIMMSEGETLAQQPILQMADTSHMVAVAEIYEDDALRVKLGEAASVESTALDRPLTGHVAHVGTMVAKNTVVGLSPTASTDLRVVEARIALDSADDARRLINLQVTAYLPAAARSSEPSVARSR
jgi:HlyD family secretion protein